MIEAFVILLFTAGAFLFAGLLGAWAASRIYKDDENG